MFCNLEVSSLECLFLYINIYIYIHLLLNLTDIPQTVTVGSDQN